jgi:hypothetical protein
MTTHFITAEIDINENQEAIAQAVEQELAKHGEPLRWAIASIETKAIETKADASQPRLVANIEAIVTRSK